ncbi:DNA N-6-adenine-methyltransferase [Ciceribacter sp. L1K22]|uniref:DNA N-6-adenine-methyltransferase n=1 Tax=Ciceribacter sp. L1K22 TaxID=2820275 RepID=UPI001ABE373A|nr:DNA N-6-adenine-methyltransferase [Ciceribacter sp. L1K22]MBO3760396.1 adenine methyltransferase [Ciceribacter sp. L1K22]
MTGESPLFAGIGGHQSARSRTDEWLTPPFIIAALGGPASFDLDPCAPAKRPWATATRHYTAFDNGLILPWFGRVWLNPPYSTSLLGRFMGRMAAHGTGTALIFARTETEAFFRHVWDRATALLFMEGRINFHLPSGKQAKGNAGAPTVLIAYGDTDAEILSGSGIAGKFVPLLLPRFWSIGATRGTWRDAIVSFLKHCDGPVRLDELYRAFAHHPKASTNPNYDAKIRQELQRGPFRRIDRGLWEYADEH